MNLTTTTDLLSEQSVLGSILVDSAVLDDVSFLEDRDFLTATHQEIFKVMKYLDDRDQAIDVLTVTQEYQRYGDIRNIGGVQYLADLMESVPSTANAKFYAKDVRSKALRRRGTAIGEKIAKLGEEGFESDEDYFIAAESLVDEMRPVESGRMRGLKEIRTEYFDHIKKVVSTILTGFSKFDTWSGGLGRGWLFVSAGRPSVGKTAMLLQRVTNISKKPTAGVVAIWSQEMKDAELIDRMVSNMTGINFGKITKKKLDDFELEQVNIVYEQLESKLIFINDAAGVSIQEVRAEARKLKKRYGKIDLLAVDYLQIMNIPQAKGESRAQAIGKVTTAAKQIAREMDTPFMMLSQMSRESEQKKKPTLSDLKESSSIEQDADVVEFLWWDQNDTDPGGKVIQQFIAKGRSIGINEFRLLFKGWKQHFEEMSGK